MAIYDIFDRYRQKMFFMFIFEYFTSYKAYRVHLEVKNRWLLKKINVITVKKKQIIFFTYGVNLFFLYKNTNMDNYISVIESNISLLLFLI